jgi:uncharacterized membrane protein YhaH (DUF805 family)
VPSIFGEYWSLVFALAWQLSWRVFSWEGSWGENAEAAALIVGAILGLAGTVVMAFAVVKRLHDLNRLGTQYWYLLIPFYNLYLSLLLLFKRGTSGPNQYGDDPLAAPQGGMAVATPAA